MQSTLDHDRASAGQALAAIDLDSPGIASHSERYLNNSLWPGQGAARELEALALACGKGKARRLNALSGREIEGRDLAELYHFHFAKAAAETGERFSTFDSPTWKRALDAGHRDADAMHYASRVDARLIVSRDNEAGEPLSDDRAAVREWSARQCRRPGALLRLVRHARECLVVHWSLSRSRTWRAALADDLARLAALAHVARGEGFGILGDYADFNSSAARKAFQRLAERMASGDAIMTAYPESAETSLDSWRLEKLARV